MTTRLFLSLSLVVNVVLLGAWLMLPKHQAGVDPETPLPNDAPRLSVTADINRQPKPSSHPAKLEFHWSQVASDDPAQLEANLRSIQCPGLAIRHILIVLACDKFGPEVGAIADEVRPAFYETLASTGGNLSMFAKPQEEKLEKLEERFREFIREKPNSDGPDSEGHFTRRASKFGDILSAEEANRFNDLEGYYELMRNQAGSLPEAERELRFAALKTERMEAMQLFFNPEQIAEIEFRSSPNLKSVRPFFEATSAEWDTIKQIQLSARQTNAPQEIVQQEVVRFLGPERGEEFQRQSTPSYSEFLELTMEAGLPSETARQAHEVRLAAEKARQEMALSRAPSEYRNKWLEAWRQETMSRLQRLLGAEPYAAYMFFHHEWLKVQE